MLIQDSERELKRKMESLTTRYVNRFLKTVSKNLIFDREQWRTIELSTFRQITDNGYASIERIHRAGGLPDWYITKDGFDCADYERWSDRKKRRLNEKKKLIGLEPLHYKEWTK